MKTAALAAYVAFSIAVTAGAQPAATKAAPPAGPLPEAMGVANVA